jgi:hypothetical protein
MRVAPSANPFLRKTSIFRKRVARVSISPAAPPLPCLKRPGRAQRPATTSFKSWRSQPASDLVSNLPTSPACQPDHGSRLRRTAAEGSWRGQRMTRSQVLARSISSPIYQPLTFHFEPPRPALWHLALPNSQFDRCALLPPARHFISALPTCLSKGALL